MKILNWIKANVILLLVSLLIYHITFGVHTINPLNINWLMSVYHDWGQHYLGWAFFREEEWTFPLGTIQSYNYPAGTNVGFTDSIPLLAIFFKFFSFLLPEDFQYFGLWLYFCYFLTGFYTVKILNLYNIENKLFIYISVVLILINPVLLYRGMHPALCGQWLILASIYNYLKKSNIDNAFKININQYILLLISSLITPYLFLMVFGFSFIILIKQFFFDKAINFKMLSFVLFISVFSVITLWLIVGMITFNNDEGLEVVNSYGLYGFNLNSFYNSGGYSEIFPQQKWVLPYQYEGYAYLGIGFMILIVISSILFLINRRFSKKYFPLLIYVLSVTLFAITNKVSLNENIIFEYKTLSMIERLGSVFRASGRFIWVLYYFLMLFSLIIFNTSKISLPLKKIILIFLLSLQIYDIHSLITFRDLPNGEYKLSKFDSKEWNNTTSHFKKIITYPPFQFGLLNEMDYQDLCFIALKNNKPITCGYVARESGTKNSRFNDTLNNYLSKGFIKNEELFVTTSEKLVDFYPIIYNNQNVKIKFLDGYYLIFKENNIKLNNSIKDITLTDSLRTLISKEFKEKSIVKPIFRKDRIKYNVERFDDYENIQIKGWAFLDKSSNHQNDSIFVVLTNEQKTFIKKSRIDTRPDISQVFNNTNLINSGFRTTIFTKSIDKGKYSLALAIKHNDSLIYQLIEPNLTVNIKSEIPSKIIKEIPKPKEEVIGNIDLIEPSNNYIKIRGWAAFKKVASNDFGLKIILLNENINYLLDPQFEKRIDVTENINNGINYDNSGFNLKIEMNNFKKGDYKVGFYLKNENKEGVYITDKIVTIDN